MSHDLKILLVDDDPTMLKLLSHGLSADNDLYEVLCANNAEEAIHFLERIHIPLVVSDIQMPMMSGLDLLSKIRERWPHVSVILMSGYPTDKLATDLSRSGCLQFFHKPIKTQELRDLIYRELSGGKKENGFDGTLTNIQLPDLIQMCCSSGISTVIQVKKNERIGTIFIEEGEIIHADCGDIEGVDAFYEIFTWHSGSFETLGDVAVPKTTIDKNWQYLLMEGHRRMDEADAGEDDDDTPADTSALSGGDLLLTPDDDAGPADFALEPEDEIHADGVEGLPDLENDFLLTPEGGTGTREDPEKKDSGRRTEKTGADREPDAEISETDDGILLKTEDMAPLRVLIVDDSAMMCKVLKDMFSSDDRIEVAGSAKNGQEALEMADALHPDLITLDVNMPVMDGSTALKHIMIKNPCPVVIVSAVNSRSQSKIIDFLQLGAVDFVPKPVRSSNMDQQEQYLIGRVLQAAQANLNRFRRAKAPIAVGQKKPFQPLPAGHLIVICSGPGGYAELIKLLPRLPGDIPSGIVVLQSMTQAFAEPLAEYLDARSLIDIFALDHETPTFIGQCYLTAAGNPLQLKSVGPGFTLIPEEGPETMPELFFSSASQCFGGKILVALLSGAEIGSMSGLRRVKESGGIIIGQDVSTCQVSKPIETAEKAGLLSAQWSIPEMITQMQRVIS